jgi:Protein of unknown function (DUF1574)
MCANILRNLPIGVLGAVALVATIERTVARHRIELTSSEFKSWQMTRAAADSKVSGCDVLCFGTSMVKQGVLPVILEHRTGRRVYSLSVVGGHVPSHYYLLRRALAAGARPSAVLADFHPNFLTGSYKYIPDHWVNALGPGDCLHMAWTVKDPTFFAPLILSQVLPSLNERHQIRARLLSALRGESSDEERKALRGLVRNLKQNQGAYATARNPAYSGEVSSHYREMFLPGSWQCDPIQENYLRKFLKLAADHQITVYWVVMPICPELQAAREKGGQDDAYIRFVRSFQQYPNLVVLDGRRSRYEPGAFNDATHLNLQGASALSEDLAEIIQSRSGGSAAPNWVALPRYRERPADVPVESIQDSMLALRPRPSARR